LRDPSCGGDHILQTGREGMLGRQAIIDGDDDDVRILADADDEAAAM
jgi:hypothetical protein